ncbi:hypothetical protein DRN75_00285 [Nanoarchaeota archaeon]|nr:MAG: hypothetical protein DRN75_00285 [Nanoarchaeota archaeon]
MRLRRIRLENIRSHVRTEINLETGITVLTGRTGSGKSSILMALEYALFGSQGVNNSMILRRGAQKGRVEVEFEEQGHVYTISRGLKRIKDGVRTDPNAISVKKDNVEQNIMGRDSDLTEYVLNTLNYPRDSKAVKLFEVTSYSKQDELRAIIQMTPQARQDYIDGILQLSRYQNTWKNMKGIIDRMKGVLESAKEAVEDMNRAREEAIEKQKSLSEKESKLKQSKEKLSKLRNQLNNVKKEKLSKEKELSAVEKKYRESISTKSSIEQVKKEIESLKSSIEEEKKELESKKKMYDSIEAKDVESTQKELGEIDGLITSLKTKVKNLQKELEDILSLKVGVCPKCKQKITKDHLKTLETAYKEDISKVENELKKMEDKKSEKEKELKAAKDKYEIGKQITLLEHSIKEKSKQVKNKEKLLAGLKSKVAPHVEEQYIKLKRELDEINSRLVRVSSENSSLEKEVMMLEKDIEETKRDIESVMNRIKDLEKRNERIKRTEEMMTLLVRMREDIRNIRNVVRKRFIDAFRVEFEKQFEAIRPEEEYVVDISNDYEPVAYANNVSTPINHLSGGEKTSVALAYRLALAKIAAQIASVTPSEILILDEPTVGLDKEDIKVLPSVLRNIKTIPQVIVVTHEDVLKEAADVRYVITKKGGVSSVNLE